MLEIVLIVSKGLNEKTITLNIQKKKKKTTIFMYESSSKGYSWFLNLFI